MFDIIGNVRCIIVAAFAAAFATYFILFGTGSYRIVEIPEPRVIGPNMPFQTKDRKPICSFSIFRQTAKYASGGYVHGNGTWKRMKLAGIFHRFYPLLCNFQHGTKIPSKMLTSCLARQNVRHIVVLGDSNGMRYFTALHWHLNQLRGVQCSPVSRYFGVNWTTYEHNDVYVAHRCRCGSTDSGRCSIGFRKVGPNADVIHDWVLQALCNINANEERSSYSVVVEFIMIRHTMDKYRDVTNVVVSGCQPSSHEPIVPSISDTVQRFLLAEFFADPRPDLFMVFGNAHDSMPLRGLADDIDAFAKLIDRYVMPPTRLIWLSRIAEDVERKPTFWRELRYENGTMTRIEWLDAANRIMYKMMRRRFLQTKRLLLFPDLLQMSTPVMTDLNLDGVHMKPEWYQHVVSYILQALCAGR